MAIHAARIRRYEMRYGRDRVEQLLDAALRPCRSNGEVPHRHQGRGPGQPARARPAPHDNGGRPK